MPDVTRWNRPEKRPEEVDYAAISWEQARTYFAFHDDFATRLVHHFVETGRYRSEAGFETVKAFTGATLGVDESTFYRRLKRLQLATPAYAPRDRETGTPQVRDASFGAVQPPLEAGPVIVNAEARPAEAPEAAKPAPPPAPPRPKPSPPPEPAQAPTAALPAVLDHPDCPTCALLRQDQEMLDRRLAIHRAYHGGPAPTFLNGRTEEAVEEIDLDDAPPLPRDDPMAFPRRSTGFLSKGEQTASRRRGPRA